MSFFGSIYADPDLPHRARAVYMYLRDRAGGGSCWPGIKTIARDLRLSPRTVQRALNDLERAGYIERQRRHRENGSCTSNLYIINMDGQ
ncbi:MAG: helix-turn-helix transcriptional regulator [Oscillospiraceae bacterium]